MSQKGFSLQLQQRARACECETFLRQSKMCGTFLRQSKKSIDVADRPAHQLFRARTEMWGARGLFGVWFVPLQKEVSQRYLAFLRECRYGAYVLTYIPVISVRACCWRRRRREWRSGRGDDRWFLLWWRYFPCRLSLSVKHQSKTSQSSQTWFSRRTFHHDYLAWKCWIHMNHRIPPCEYGDAHIPSIDSHRIGVQTGSQMSDGLGFWNTQQKFQCQT